MKKTKKRYSWKREYRKRVDIETRRKISRIAAEIKETLILGAMMITPFFLMFFGWLFFGY